LYLTITLLPPAFHVLFFMMDLVVAATMVAHIPPMTVHIQDCEKYCCQGDGGGGYNVRATAAR
jgi:hypothetical protein